MLELILKEIGRITLMSIRYGVKCIDLGTASMVEAKQKLAIPTRQLRRPFHGFLALAVVSYLLVSMYGILSLQKAPGVSSSANGIPEVAPLQDPAIKSRSKHGRICFLDDDHVGADQYCDITFTSSGEIWNINGNVPVTNPEK